MKRKIDLTKTTATEKKFEFCVSIDCANSLNEWCEDEMDSYFFKIYAKNAMEAATIATLFFEEMVGNNETAFLLKDIVRMDIHRIGD